MITKDQYEFAKAKAENEMRRRGMNIARILRFEIMAKDMSPETDDRYYIETLWRLIRTFC